MLLFSSNSVKFKLFLYCCPKIVWYIITYIYKTKRPNNNSKKEKILFLHKEKYNLLICDFNCEKNVLKLKILLPSITITFSSSFFSSSFIFILLFNLRNTSSNEVELIV